MQIARKIIVLLALIGGNNVGSNNVDASELVPFTASYSTQYGMLSATGVRKLEKGADGNWVFENRASAMFAEIVENSTFSLRKGYVTPLNYSFKNPLSQKRNLSLTFNWPQATVENKARGVTLPLQGHIYDKLSYQVQLQKDVCTNPGKFGTRDYTVFDGKKFKTYRVEFIDKQTLNTGVGALNTAHLRQFRPDKDDKKYTLFWLATDFNCILARLDEQEDKDIIRLDLTSANVNGVEVKGK